MIVFSTLWPFILVACIIFVLAHHERNSRRRVQKSMASIDEMCSQISDRIADLSSENAALKERLNQLTGLESEEVELPAIGDRL